MEEMTQDDDSWSSVSSCGGSGSSCTSSGGTTEEASMKMVEEDEENEAVIIGGGVAMNDSHENPKFQPVDDDNTTSSEKQSVEELKKQGNEDTSSQPPQSVEGLKKPGNNKTTTSEERSVEELKKDLAKKDELLTTYKKQVEDLTAESTKTNEVVVTLKKKINDVEDKLKNVESNQDMAVKLLRATLLTEMLLENIDTCTDHDVINTIDSLTLGSNKFDVAELKGKAVKFAREVVNRKPTFSVAVLAALDSSAIEDDGSDVEEFALATIRSTPDMLLESCTLLGFERMESIMADKEIQADEYFMFRVLFAWSNTTANDDLATSWRKQVASALTKHIALEKIDPTRLGSEVWKSGLVSDNQIIEAFVKQSPQAKKNMSFEQRHRARPLPKGAWESSGNQLLEHRCFVDTCTFKTDKVVGNIMNTPGVYKWSFRVINSSSHVFCGIALATTHINGSDYIGKTFSTWGFSTGNGATYHKGAMDYSNSALLSEKLPFSGTIIKFVLTISDDGLNNSLETSVGSKDTVRLFSGQDLIAVGGFVPAASLYGSATIEFHGFER